MKIGLVLEGGGMRGAYTVGVLDILLEHNFKADYVVGVSAGASNGASYISEQRGRGYRVTFNYLNDKRYLSFRNFFKTKSLFGMDFLFDLIPNKLDPFDYDTLQASSCEFKAGVSDIETGKTVFFGKDDMKNHCTVLRASSSLPIFSPIVEYKGGKYLDGGVTDPIPVRKAFEDGCDKVIVILTQQRSYIKSPQKLKWLYKHKFKAYPKLIEAMDNRHIVYNNSLAEIRELEKTGKALVIAPSRPLQIGRFEKDKKNLEHVYQLGKDDAKEKLSFILNIKQNN